MEFKHKSVMLEECLQGLNLKDGGIYFDGTLGGAGHSYEILKRKNTTLIATDRDLDAIKTATNRLSEFEGRFTIVHDNFKNFKNVIDSLNVFGIDGALLDLGVSSYQLDNRERGFSYLSSETRLDMRMDRTNPFSAYELINTYDEAKLKYVLSTYGEEKFAPIIAKNICLKRKVKPIETTGELTEICDMSIPFKFRRDTHSAKKTFQAIRIAVNEELDGLEDALRDMVKALNKGGRIAVISFHSLEDRIVKNVFKDFETACICDKRFPCVCNRKQVLKILTNKPIVASQQEQNENSRSKCAKLRIAEKL